MLWLTAGNTRKDLKSETSCQEFMDSDVAQMLALQMERHEYKPSKLWPNSAKRSVGQQILRRACQLRNSHGAHDPLRAAGA